MLNIKHAFLVWALLLIGPPVSCNAKTLTYRRSGKDKKKNNKTRKRSQSRALQTPSSSRSSKGKGKGGSTDAPDLTCAWPEPGGCLVTPDFSLRGVLRFLFCDSPVQNGVACSLFELFLEGFLNDILNPGIPIISFCVGEFTGRQIKDDVTKDIGCRDIPVNNELEYGVIAAEYDAPGLKMNQCTIANPPHCTFVWAMSFNQAFANYILVTLPTLLGGPAGTIFSSILNLAANVDKVAFGIAERPAFDVAFSVFTPEGFQYESQFANFFVRTRLSDVFLPVVVNNILPTSGEGTIYWAWGLDAPLNIEALGNGADPVGLGLQYSLALKRVMRTKINLGAILFGFLPKLDLRRATEWAYLQRDEGGDLTGLDLEPGYYSSWGAEVPLINDNAEAVCDFFEGVGVTCPDIIRFDPFSRMGWYYQFFTGKFGITFEWLDFLELTCTHDGFNAEENVVNCVQKDGTEFQINLENRRGLTVRSSHAPGGVRKETVFQVSKDTYDSFGDFSLHSVSHFKGIHGIHNRTMDELKAVGGGVRRLESENIAFGFKHRQRCIAGEDDVTLFDARDEAFAEYWGHYGHDGSLRNCFTACVIGVRTAQPSEVPLCCEYRGAVDGELDQPACFLREQSMEIFEDSVSSVYASETFLEEFDVLASSFE